MSTVGDLITFICIAIALWYVPRYLWRQYFRGHMSSDGRVRSVPLTQTEPVYSASPPRNRNAETPNLARSADDIERDKISFAETAVADALARLILADELDKTKAIKIGAGKKSGEGYQKWARLVGASIDRQKEPQFLDENGGRVPASYPVSGRRS